MIKYITNNHTHDLCVCFIFIKFAESFASSNNAFKVFEILKNFLKRSDKTIQMSTWTFVVMPVKATRSIRIAFKRRENVEIHTQTLNLTLNINHFPSFFLVSVAKAECLFNPNSTSR